MEKLLCKGVGEEMASPASHMLICAAVEVLMYLSSGQLYSALVFVCAGD